MSTVLPSAVRTTLTSGLPLGKGLPTVDPEDIAAAVVRTVSTRRAQTPVPGYLAALDVGLALAPEPLITLVRRLIGGNRAVDVRRPGRTRGLRGPGEVDHPNFTPCASGS